MPPTGTRCRQTMLAVSAVVLACCLGQGEAVAGTASEDYNAARAAYHSFKANTKHHEYRHHWMKVIAGFDAVARNHATSSKADDSIYMVGALYYDLYSVSYLTSDLDSARKAFQRLIDKYPHSNLADDAQFLIGKTYKAQKKNTKAYLAFKKVLDDYPDGDMRASASREMGKLPKPKNVAVSTPVPTATPVIVKATPTPLPDSYYQPSTLVDVKSWSNPDYSRIGIYVGSEVEFTHAKLEANPEVGKPPRIYVDLKRVTIGDSFADTHTQTATAWEVPIGDGLLSRARVAQFTPDTVRVVLDLESIENYNVIPLSDPFRVLIDVYAEDGKAKSKAVAAAENKDPTHQQTEERIERLLQTDQKQLAEQFALKFKTVVIDPGHGGHDTGAIGPGGAREKDVVLDVSKRVAEKLRAEGLNVLMTRSDDTYPTLEERTALANKLGADLFVSIHANASTNGNARGAETYFLDTASDAQAAKVAARENAMTEKKVSDLDRILDSLIRNAYVGMSADLAATVQSGIVTAKSSGRSLWDRGVKTAPFYVLLTANMPAVLVETGFISNPKEETMLKEGKSQEQIATGIAAGIVSYLEASQVVLPPPPDSDEAQGSKSARKDQ